MQMGARVISGKQWSECWSALAPRVCSVWHGVGRTLPLCRWRRVWLDAVRIWIPCARDRPILDTTIYTKFAAVFLVFGKIYSWIDSNYKVRVHSGVDWIGFKYCTRRQLGKKNNRFAIKCCLSKKIVCQINIFFSGNCAFLPNLEYMRIKASEVTVWRHERLLINFEQFITRKTARINSNVLQPCKKCVRIE